MKNIIKWVILTSIVQILFYSCSSSNNRIITHLPFRLTDKGNWGIISTDGKIAISGEYVTPPYAATEGIYIIRRDDGMFEFYKAAQVPARIGGQYLKVAAFSESLAPVMEREDVISVINTSGETIFTLDQTNGKRIVSCECFSEGFALIEDEDGLKGFVNKKGEIVIKPQYNEAYSFKNGYAVVKSGEGEKSYWQIINKKGRVILDMGPEAIKTSGYVSSGLLGYTKSPDLNTWGFVSIKGENIVEPSKDYISVSEVNNSKFIFSNGEKYGVSEISGKRVIPAEYDNIETSGERNFIVKKGDNFFIIDLNNKETVNVDFTDHTGNLNGFIYAKVRDKYLLTDSKGKRVGDGEYSEVMLNMPPSFVSIELLNFRKTVIELFQTIAPGKLWRLTIGDSAQDVALLLGSGSPERLRATRTLTTRRVANDIEANLSLGFSSELGIAITEREMLRDMWGRAYWDNVIKGYTFNEASYLQEISVNVKLLGNMKGKEREFAEAVAEEAKRGGFTQSEKEEGSIKLNTAMGRTISIGYIRESGLSISLR